ncbi:MAG: DUF1592 domain-containing protein [Verrucomicrobiales bacterium]
MRIHNQIWPIVSSLSIALVAVFHPASLHGEEEVAVQKQRGAAIYRSQCAQCHGASGEGVDGEYDKPLYGSRSVEKLADLIGRTMPEDEPELCVGDDAAAVSAYIYDAFYSPDARGNPPEILPARLTNRQYLESIADLIGTFTDHQPEGNSERQGKRRGRRDESVPDEIKNATEGLRADYFESNGMNKKDKRSLQRIDPSVDFDFGEGSPAENINAEQFSIAWSGSIVARETGVHEFRVRTPNGARLYVNADLKPGDSNYRDDSSAPSQTPLIDAWVSSGEMREETGRVLLLGGRRYLIRLDYFKYKEKVSSIRLEWKPPHGDWEVPARSDFVPTMVSRVAVVNAPFPADDRSLGYERGAAVSKEWFNAVTAAAIEVATEVDDRIDSLSRSRPDAEDRVAKLRTFASRFVSLAFRRPLTAGQQRAFVDTKFETAETPEQAVKRVVLFSLLSPEFLFPTLNDRESPDAFDIASRLAMELWDSLPDETLLNVAASGGLDDISGVREQIQRMTDDPRTRSKMLSFFHHWFEMDGERDLLKDDQVYPEFNPGVIADLRHSLNLSIEDIVWSENSDYRQLLLADSLFLNDRLVLLYGNADSGEPSEGFRRVTFAPAERSGVITHPYLLSAFAYHNNSSPIHRGVFLTRNIVGRPLKPPPVAIEFKDGEFDPSLTMREKVTQVTRDNACMSCHSIINPLGFSLEEFDAIGRLRKEDNSKPVDTTSDYTTDSGDKVTFTGARDVATHAANSPTAHQAFVNHLFHYIVKQPITAYGKQTPGQLRDQFEKNEFNIRDLLAEIVTVSAIEGTNLEIRARRSKYRQPKAHTASTHPENL